MLRKIKGLKGKCKICGRQGRLTRHHILPRKYKGKSIYICEKCHENIHKKWGYFD